MTIDRSNATINDTWQFDPFAVPAAGQLLKQANLPANYELLVIERKGERRAFSMQEMAYHHVAQGELAGEPYLVSF